jgi:hypothetical protein
MSQKSGTKTKTKKESEDALDLKNEEIEETEDSEDTSSESNEEAIAAASSGTTELSGSFKNFRHHPDMENFYRFIYENDLRHEALAIIHQIIAEKKQKKLKALKTSDPGK